MAEKIGISLDKETLQLCDKYAAEHSRSRSEFIAAAIQKYVSDLELGRQKNIIAKELAGEIVKGSEAGVAKISNGLFRYAVEVEIIIMILADIPPKIIEEFVAADDDLPDKKPYTSLLVNRLEYNKENGIKNFTFTYREELLKNLSWDGYDGIRDDPRFKAVEDSLKI